MSECGTTSKMDELESLAGHAVQLMIHVACCLMNKRESRLGSSAVIRYMEYIHRSKLTRLSQTLTPADQNSISSLF